MKSDFYANKPSNVTETYWLYAKRKKGKYPINTENCGKWLIFVDVRNIDEMWEKIKIATENGLLGNASKVATAKENPYTMNSNKRVICVYTYDYTDKEDVMRIRESLREIGIKSKIPYKTDNATIEGKYQVKGDERISVYYE
jgi:hypothetical protein